MGTESNTKPVAELIAEPQAKYIAILGPAGSGKSHLLRQRINENPRYALLTATTGIAALNLGENVTTLHSALGFYDLESLRESYPSVVKRFMALIATYENIVIDEASMLSGEMLDLLVKACEEAIVLLKYKLDHAVSSFQSSLFLGRPYFFGFIVTGDFCQLPPVEGKFAFEAESWKHFEITRLTTIHRQSEPKFLEALKAAREGKGVSCTQLLAQLSIPFVDSPELGFEGTTLYPTNPLANAHNRKCYEALEGFEGVSRAIRWGKQKSEWKLVPDELRLKVGAEVMALANYSVRKGKEELEEEGFEPGEEGVNTRRLVYANGSMGVVEGITEDKGREGRGFIVRFHGTGEVTEVFSVVRQWAQTSKPQTMLAIDYTGPLPSPKTYFEYLKVFGEYQLNAKRRGAAFFDPEQKKWILGEITFVPLQLAYALTIHKSQGLSLDRAQVDARTQFAGKEASMYVAMSRVRTPNGLQIVGSRTTMARRVKTHQKVRQFI